MHITFYCNTIPFHLNSLEEHPLGGTESSVLSLSKELARRGNLVTIIADYPQYHNKDGVELMPANCFDMQHYETDVMIIVKSPILAVQPNIRKYKKVIYWATDNGYIANLEHLYANTQGLMDNIDHVVVLSDYVLKQSIQQNEKLFNKIQVIRFGVDTDYIKEPTKNKETIQCSYHSMPYRGVCFLLDVWEKIVEKKPNAYLNIFAGNQIYGNGDDDNDWLWNRARRIKNVKVHGAVPQALLCEALSHIDIHLYPTDFIESSCAAVSMSLASGCTVVATDLGALNEQVNDDNGVLIYGHAGHEKYQEQFVEETLFLMNNERLLREKQNNARDILKNSWKNISEEWLQLMEKK